MKTMRTKLLALAGALALTLLIAVGALTGGGAASALAAAATPGTTGTGQANASNFLGKLAANLGIGEDRLTETVKQTNLQLIDEAVAAGTLTADQAQAARDRVNNSADGGGFGVRLGGDRGHRPMTPPDAHAAARTRAEAADRAAHRLALEVERLRGEGITSLGGLARALTERGMPTPRGGGAWTHTTVARVLTRADV